MGKELMGLTMNCAREMMPIVLALEQENLRM